MRSKHLDRTEAETIAVNALAFLVQDGERLARFLALTGLGPDTIRKAAASPSFLAAVLDYVVSDEALLIVLAGEIGSKPETVVNARRLLAPPEPPE
jgi:hypothetical protein